MNIKRVYRLDSKELVTSKVKDYQQLVKLRLTLTVVISSILAYLIALEGSIQWVGILTLGLGGFLVTGAANALNQVLEKDFDKLMKRTANRPLAAGRMTMSEGVIAAGFMSMSGIVLLALFNPWTAFLGMFAMVSYAFLYTPLKRITPAAVAVGAIPGALPALIGSTAAVGELSSLAFALFTIQFLWQFPHFWSIGWLGNEDYQKAGYKMVPLKNGKVDRNIGLQSFAYAFILVPICFLPWYFGVTGILSCIIAATVSMGYAYFGWMFYRKMDKKSALSLMFYSFLYIPVVFIAFFIDKI